MWKERSNTRLNYEEAEREIAQRLRARRTELGYSYQTLAELTGMSKSSLQRYETGGIMNIPLSRLETLTNALGVSPDWLLGWSTEPTPAKSHFKDLLSTVPSSETVDYAIFDRVIDELMQTNELWDLISGYAKLNEGDRRYLMQTLKLLLGQYTADTTGADKFEN